MGETSHSVFFSRLYHALTLITRVLCLRSSKLSFRVLLSEASVVLSDDITSPSGSVELLRLTLTKLLFSLAPAPSLLPPELAVEPDASASAAPISALIPDASLIQICCSSLQVDNQLYNRASFHFPVLLCQDQRGGAESGTPWSSEANPAQSPEALEDFKRSCFLQLRMLLSGDRCTVEEVGFILLCSLSHKQNCLIYYQSSSSESAVVITAVLSNAASLRNVLESIQERPQRSVAQDVSLDSGLI